MHQFVPADVPTITENEEMTSSFRGPRRIALDAFRVVPDLVGFHDVVGIVPFDFLRLSVPDENRAPVAFRPAQLIVRIGEPLVEHHHGFVLRGLGRRVAHSPESDQEFGLAFEVEIVVEVAFPLGSDDGQLSPSPFCLFFGQDRGGRGRRRGLDDLEDGRTGRFRPSLHVPDLDFQGIDAFREGHVVQGDHVQAVGSRYLPVPFGW